MSLPLKPRLCSRQSCAWMLAALVCTVLPSVVLARGGHGGGHHGGHHGHHHAHHHHHSHHHHHDHHHHGSHHYYAGNGWHGYHDGWHNGWHHGYWGGWGGWPSGWGGAGYGLGAAAGLGAVAYNNPYYGGTYAGAGYDYSQPLPAANTYANTAGTNGAGTSGLLAADNEQTQAEAEESGDPVSVAENGAAGETAEGTQLAENENAEGAENAEGEMEPPTAEPTDKQNEGLAELERAREAFKRGQWAEAEQLADKAVTLLPEDTAAHEFRALTLFSQHKYRDAAAAIYAVLSVGPGWNEETLQSLYGNSEQYAHQLDALKTYVRENPQAADGLFLLAYHELTAGQLDSARTNLEHVVELEPKDHVATELVEALNKPRTVETETKTS